MADYDENEVLNDFLLVDRLEGKVDQWREFFEIKFPRKYLDKSNEKQNLKTYNVYLERYDEDDVVDPYCAYNLDIKAEVIKDNYWGQVILPAMKIARTTSDHLRKIKISLNGKILFEEVFS